MISYASRQLKSHEVNYPMHDLKARGCGLCTQYLASLLVLGSLYHLHGLQEFEVLDGPAKSKYEAV